MTHDIIFPPNSPVDGRSSDDKAITAWLDVIGSEFGYFRLSGESNESFAQWIVTQLDLWIEELRAVQKSVRTRVPPETPTYVPDPHAAGTNFGT
jgi:hypothetical protein